MTYNAAGNVNLPARLVDSELRRHGGLALLNLGYGTAAREVLAGGYPTWPTIRQARSGMPGKLWWISLDPDTIALLRMMLRTPNPARTPLKIPAAA